jgi:PPM family protein phosphatase
MSADERLKTTDSSRRVTDVRFEAVGVTDIGRQRKHNEDHVLLRPELDLFVVADGMGGHNAGDVASRLATASLRNFFEATVDGVPESQRPGEPYQELTPGAQRLAAAVRKANRDVFEISSTYRQHHGMGSTVVACHLSRNRGLMHVGHVGDSRCYRFRDGQLTQLTHDHSLVNDALALKPDLTPEELARLPKNIITRALGMREDVKVDIHSDEVRERDVFLLCSDGLSGMVDEAEIGSVLALAVDKPDADLRDACETLVHLANEAGGTDNITALLVRIDGLVIDDEPDVVTDGNLRLNTAELEALALEGSERERRPCPKCGAQVTLDNVFCTECGTLMSPA